MSHRDSGEGSGIWNRRFAGYCNADRQLTGAVLGHYSGEFWMRNEG